LQAAWQETTNEDIAEPIIGFIRKADLVDALIPYSDHSDSDQSRLNLSPFLSFNHLELKYSLFER
jgi:hypothetical protein